MKFFRINGGGSNDQFQVFSLFEKSFEKAQEKIDIETIVNALEFAGKYVGLCDSRPKYGQFTCTVEEQ